MIDSMGYHPSLSRIWVLFMVGAVVVGCGAKVSFECADGTNPSENGCTRPGGGNGGNGGDSTGGTGLASGQGGGTNPGSGGGGSGGGTGNTFCPDPVVGAGSLNIGPSDAVVGLCGGKVLVGNRMLNRVELIDVTQAKVVTTWQLTAAPGDIVYDDVTDTAYVGLLAANTLVKINLGASDVKTIDLDAPVVRLALGNEGTVFASLDDDAVWPARPIAIVNGPEGTVKATIVDKFAGLLAFDRPGHQLILGELGISPATLTRYAFDPMVLTLTFVEDRWDSGSNGQDLAISPDGDHLAFPCGGGNGTGYTVFDFSSNDLTKTFGEWTTNAYPRAAAFTADGKKLVATNGSDLQVFDTTTHVLLHSQSVTACSYGDLHRVSASPAGGIAYGISKCGFDNDSGRLYWFVQ